MVWTVVVITGVFRYDRGYRNLNVLTLELDRSTEIVCTVALSWTVIKHCNGLDSSTGIDCSSVLD